jgi:ABC-type branched-subunit amino acid transport system substrate-binding protein
MAPALALVLAGCGSDHHATRGSAGTLSVYTSIPRKGVLAAQGRAIAAGQRLALADARGRADGRRVRLIELDSATDGDSPWDPARIESNARRAGGDPTAVAYLGEVGLGGSAVSVPVTNADGLLQVSPGDSLPSLTQPDPGGGGEGPARYYPKHTRTFIRLVPHGGLEAKVLVAWARERGARSLAIVRDQEVLGTELTSWLLDASQRSRIPVEAERARPGEDDYGELAQRVADRHPGAVVLAMAAGKDADLAVGALRAALPSVPILSTSGVSGSPPQDVDYVDPHLPSQRYPRAARPLLERLHGGPEEVAGLYGYESMRLALGAIARAHARSEADRARVVAAAAGLRRLDGPLGPLSIVPGGDVSTAVFGSYRELDTGLHYLGLRSAESARTRPRPPAP